MMISMKGLVEKATMSLLTDDTYTSDIASDVLSPAIDKVEICFFYEEISFKFFSSVYDANSIEWMLYEEGMVGDGEILDEEDITYIKKIIERVQDGSTFECKFNVDKPVALAKMLTL